MSFILHLPKKCIFLVVAVFSVSSLVTNSNSLIIKLCSQTLFNFFYLSIMTLECSHAINSISFSKNIIIDRWQLTFQNEICPICKFSKTFALAKMSMLEFVVWFTLALGLTKCQLWRRVFYEMKASCFSIMGVPIGYRW